MTRQATHTERETENRERKRERDCMRKRENPSTAEREETHLGTKREVNKACRSVPSQWHHSGDATSTHRERERERETEKREKERSRLRMKETEKERERTASTAKRGETYIGTKREVNKACCSVPSQWHHSGDATSTHRERGERGERPRKEREREIVTEKERESEERVLQKEGRHTWDQER